MTQTLQFDMRQHLKERCFDLERYSSVFVDSESACLPLWNLSGQMVGYQVYSPLKPKNHQLAPRDQKYFTYVSRYFSATPALAVWGLETLYYIARQCCSFVKASLMQPNFTI